jgi:1-deoxy-D-xylulose-5-phosphate reductoisomerase
MKRLAVLGVTGSIGRQTLDVAARQRERVRVVALAAGRDLEGLARAARGLDLEAVALEHVDDEPAARERLAAAAPGARIEIGLHAAARLTAAVDADVVVNGIVGAAGLRASLAALARGARLALANKETLVVGGPLIRRALEKGGELIPVDSEHNAALLLLGGRPPAEIAKLTLTASGGALREHPDWRRATRDEVLAHPVWRMGPRITVDSALLFNKGLELIEAHWLFGLEWDQLDACIHPETLVHALVTFRDGAMALQAAPADMRLPIQTALSWPAHWDGGVPALAPEALGGLTFRPIVPGRHPAFDVALAAGRMGGTAPCALNAADEVAVGAFLHGRIGLARVPEILARVVERHAVSAVESIEQLEAVDREARATAEAEVARS